MATDHTGAWNDVFTEWDYRFQGAGTPVVNDGTGGQNLSTVGSPTFQSGGLGGGPTSTTYAITNDGSSSKFEYDATTCIPTVAATEGAVGCIFKGPTDSGKRQLWQILDNASPFERFECYKRREDADPTLSGRWLFRFQDNVSDSWWWVHDISDASYINPFDDNWHIMVLRQKADGATGPEFWLDGQLQKIDPLGANGLGYDIDWWMASNFDGSSSSEEYTICGSSAAGDVWHGELAGWGITDVAPSDAQIIQMAEDFEFDTGVAKYTVKNRRNPARYKVYNYT